MEAKLVTTIKKLKPKAKIKRKNRVNTVVITASKLNGSGIVTTLNDGLSFGTFPFGTRVQDEKISINSGDVLDVLGVFESFDTSDPTAPRMTLTSISSVAEKTTDLIIGERITGTDSGAVAIVAEREKLILESLFSIKLMMFLEKENLLSLQNQTYKQLLPH